MRANQLSALLLLLSLLAGAPAKAHKMRSVLLTVTEQPTANGGNTIVLDLKSSINNEGRPAAVTTEFSPACASQGQSIAERLDDAVLRRYTVYCEGGLQNRSLAVRGLDATTPDAFVEVRFANGGSSRHGLSRSSTSIALNSETSHGPAQLAPYFGIGVEHILLGPDHLLFVLGLLLLLRQTRSSWRTLLGTITAFTVAHSITLALAILAGVTLPSTPVEMVIALSILLLATEIYHYPQRQQRGLPPTLTASKPWLVAFAFGLLHGFGFAGALADIGVPDNAAAWALLLFNLGVEAGQLLFVAAVLLLFVALARLPQKLALIPITQMALTHVIGGLAFFWLIERGQQLLPA